MKKRKIAILSGTRADYGIMSSVIRAIEKNPQLNLDYEIIAACMHLSPEYGYTIQEIEEDGKKIGAKVEMLLNSDTCAAQVKGLGIGTIGFAQALEKIKPDFILMLGDRGELISAALAANLMGIPVAHMHGGEKILGGIDEFIRHAVTKLSHIHFPATKKSMQNIIRMGEEEWRVHLTGAAGVDFVHSSEFYTREELAKKFNFDPKKKMLLVIIHPVTTEFSEAVSNMEHITGALLELKEQTIWVYSNADAGNKRMMQRMNALLEGANALSFIRIVKSLPHKLYLSAMKNCDVMVSNSSSGIIEAPSCGIPVVDVGSRQRERECTPYTIHVNYNKTEIVEAVKKVLSDKTLIENVKKCENPYDPFKDGKNGYRIAEFLSKVKIDKKLLDKKFTY